jgi:hypothetical protein
VGSTKSRRSMPRETNGMIGPSRGRPVDDGVRASLIRHGMSPWDSEIAHQLPSPAIRNPSMWFPSLRDHSYVMRIPLSVVNAPRISVDDGRVAALELLKHVSGPTGFLAKTSHSALILIRTDAERFQHGQHRC